MSECSDQEVIERAERTAKEKAAIEREERKAREDLEVAQAIKKINEYIRRTSYTRSNTIRPSASSVNRK